MLRTQLVCLFLDSIILRKELKLDDAYGCQSYFAFVSVEYKILACCCLCMHIMIDTFFRELNRVKICLK